MGQTYQSSAINASAERLRQALMGTRAAALVVILLASLLMAGQAASVGEREGWRVIETEYAYPALLERLRDAVRAEEMGLVTDVGPTETAAQRDVHIPGNRVIGVFRNDFAVSVLRISVAAMIEAPIRFYVTEESDGTATLSWKTPTHVFSPYFDEGGDALRDIARDLDGIFEAIAEQTVSED